MLLALGDWTNKVGQNTAHRYAASKYTLSWRAKHTVLSCAKSLEHYKSWEEIPPEVLVRSRMWRRTRLRRRSDWTVFGFGKE